MAVAWLSFLLILFLLLVGSGAPAAQLCCHSLLAHAQLGSSTLTRNCSSTASVAHATKTVADLLAAAGSYAVKAEAANDITYIVKSNSLRKTAKERFRRFKQFIVQSLKNFKYILVNLNQCALQGSLCVY
uniref:Putative secreted protein n=1 Tax=Amblyomma cajennense TaxID=34607 RepID=A0A023FE12_AMBCJ